MLVRLTQLDGKLPNIALMKIAYHHRGDELVFRKYGWRGLDELDYDRVYGSAIFNFSSGRVAEFKRAFPQAVVGGTWNIGEPITVEQALGLSGDDEHLDYSIYPGFEDSIGFTQRGCRLKCGFCVVPKKEGKPRSVNTIADIWRGPPYPKHLHLLDNDFFGQSREQWEARIDEIQRGGFKVCLNQGINVRMIDDAAARALAQISVRDDQFKVRRLYTAWDNLGDERRFFAGVELLEHHGLPPTCLLVYMLVGYDPRETWERVLYRFSKMTARGIRPYPIWSWFTDVFLPRFDQNAGLLVVQTRWHVDDLMGRFLERQPNIKVLRYPAIAEKDTKHHEWIPAATPAEPFRELAKPYVWKAGEPLFPEWKPLDFLLERKRFETEASWSSLYQQHPIIVGGGELPIDKFKGMATLNRTGGCMHT
jgi:hypothetical protein